MAEGYTHKVVSGGNTATKSDDVVVHQWGTAGKDGYVRTVGGRISYAINGDGQDVSGRERRRQDNKKDAEERREENKQRAMRESFWR